MGAALALGDMKDPYAVEPLIDVLKVQNAQFRADAASALERMHDRRALEPLRRMLHEDPDGSVRNIASEVYWNIKGYVDAADRRELMRRPVTYGKPEIMDQYIADLRYPDGDVQQAAEMALGRMGAIDPLIEEMKDPTVQGGHPAVLGLKLIKDSRVVERLLPLLKDPNIKIRMSAAMVLANRESPPLNLYWIP